MKLTVMVVVIVFAIALPPALAADAVGSVSQVKGAVQLKRGGRESVAALADPVLLNDQFTTARASIMSISLADGGTLEIGESSNLRIDQYVIGTGATPTSRIVSMLAGVIHPVVRAAAGTNTFEVHTPNAVAAVRGTDFIVRFSHGQARPGFGGCGTYTDVSVFAGTVAVSNSANPNVTVDVGEGYATTVPCLHAPLTPGPVGLAGAGAVAAPVAAAPPPACPPCSVVGARAH